MSVSPGSFKNGNETPQRVLSALSQARREALSSSDIHDLLSVEITIRQVRRTLSKLETAGYVEKVRDPLDGRAHIWKVTDEADSFDMTPPVRLNISQGYSVIRHSYQGETYSCPVHRLVAVAEFGFESVTSSQIHHKNKHKLDNSPSNLIPLSPHEHSIIEAVGRLVLDADALEAESVVECVDALGD